MLVDVDCDDGCFVRPTRNVVPRVRGGSHVFLLVSATRVFPCLEDKPIKKVAVEDTVNLGDSSEVLEGGGVVGGFSAGVDFDINLQMSRYFII